MKMQKKYVLSLIVIGVMFLFVLATGTGYGVWLATKNNNEKVSSTLNCFKVYFSNNGIIEMKNIDSIINEEGIETSPYTLTITNICENTKELQVRLNVLESSTIETKALTISAAGNIEKEITSFDNLPTTKTTQEDVTQSKLIGLAQIKPNETIRTNIRIWFDEKKAPNIDPKQVFKARFEFIDTESSIKSSFSEILINKLNNDTKTPDYSTISTTSEGLYKIVENDVTTYYYRGNVTDNYVNFANLTWRIVGVNSDKSVKLILDKSSAYQSFSTQNNAPDYTGLKYIYNNVEINNNINTYLLNWYNQNIVNNNLDLYVQNHNFCNDASYTVNNYHTYYNAYNRLVTNKTPTTSCNQRSADYGGTYNQKVGLITADEVVIAGGQYNTANNSYYLANGENFFTLSPAEYYNYNSYMFIVNNNGSLSTASTITQQGIRPVINLKADLTVSGSGTVNDPYTIDIE